MRMGPKELRREPEPPAKLSVVSSERLETTAERDVKNDDIPADVVLAHDVEG